MGRYVFTPAIFDSIDRTKPGAGGEIQLTDAIGGLLPELDVYGYTFDDPANIPFWWERGALTAWQVVHTTIEELTRYNLWESDFFSPFKPLADIAGGDPAVEQALAQSLASQISFGPAGRAGPRCDSRQRTWASCS